MNPKLNFKAQEAKYIMDHSSYTYMALPPLRWRGIIGQTEDLTEACSYLIAAKSCVTPTNKLRYYLEAQNEKGCPGRGILFVLRHHLRQY